MSPNETQTGEKVAYSESTDTWYLALEWEDHGDGKIVTHRKREITEEEARERMEANR